MTQAMPELQKDGLDVSAAEERYLRRAFHRFSLPYLVVILAVVGIATLAPPFAPPAPDSTAAEPTRLDALEGGVAKLSQDVRAARPARLVGVPSAELKSRMDHAHQRINALERRLTDALEGRLPEGDPLEKPKRSPPWPPASPSLP